MKGKTYMRKNTSVLAGGIVALAYGVIFAIVTALIFNAALQITFADFDWSGYTQDEIELVKSITTFIIYALFVTVPALTSVTLGIITILMSRNVIRVKPNYVGLLVVGIILCVTTNLISGLLVIMGRKQMITQDQCDNRIRTEQVNAQAFSNSNDDTNSDSNIQ